MHHFGIAVLIAVWSVLTLVLSACDTGGGGSSSDGPGPYANIAGTWFGPFVDSPAYLDFGTVSATVAGSGSLSYSQNATTIHVPTTGTGTISLTQTPVYGTSIGGFNGGFIVDSTRTHAGWIDATYSVSVLQKGGTSLPTYAVTDLVGTWTGTGVTVNPATFALVSQFPVTATITGSGSPLALTGSDVHGAFTSGVLNIFLYFPTHAQWGGQFVQGATTYYITGYMSPDKLAIGYTACVPPVVFTFPGQCTLGFLTH